MKNIQFFLIVAFVFTLLTSSDNQAQVSGAGKQISIQLGYTPVQVGSTSTLR